MYVYSALGKSTATIHNGVVYMFEDTFYVKAMPRKTYKNQTCHTMMCNWDILRGKNFDLFSPLCSAVMKLDYYQNWPWAEHRTRIGVKDKLAFFKICIHEGRDWWGDVVCAPLGPFLCIARGSVLSQKMFALALRNKHFTKMLNTSERRANNKMLKDVGIW